MIRSYRRAADAQDLQAMTQDKGSLGRNILMVTLPIGVVLFLGVYWLARSYWAALVVAGAVALGSIWSNVQFFRTVGGRGRPGSEHSTVALQGHYSNGDIEVFRARPETLQEDLENAFGKGRPDEPRRGSR